MSSIGLFGGSFKVFNKGHYNAILQASTQNDKVFLFVSTKNRERKNEIPITWEMMHPIWELYIKDILPGNVELFYVNHPVGSIIDTLIEANNNTADENIYSVYGDEKDLKSYYDNKRVRNKYLARLLPNNQIKFVTTKRTESGTNMRKCLELNQQRDFILGLPLELKEQGKEIFDMLRSKN